jgi:hypothetical protein
MLGEKMEMYNSQEKMEQKMWQNPKEGRLLGRFEEPLPPPSTLVTFKDVAGEMWQVNVNELSAGERGLLERQENVRLLGKITDEGTNLFYSCGAFPWTFDKPMSREDMRAAREAFSMKVESFKESAEHYALEAQGREDADKDSESPCSEMEPIKRMGRPQ